MKRSQTDETQPLVDDSPPQLYHGQIPSIELSARAEVIRKRVKKLVKVVISMVSTIITIATMVLFAKGWYDEEDLLVRALPCVEYAISLI